MENYYSDKKTIQLAMLLLFLSLLVIYVLLFAIRGEELDSNTIITTPTLETSDNIANITIASNTTDSQSEVSISTPDLMPGHSDNTTRGENNSSATISFNDNEMDEVAVLNNDINTNIQSTRDTTGFGFNTTVSTTTQTENTLDIQDDIYILSGTEKYYGPIKSIEALGIDYQYALKDAKDIYYIFLGNYQYDFDQIARQLDGNTYKLSTEQEIIENKLFGERITFINIPQYQNDTVIMLVNIDGMSWLMQIDYAIYHESKGYLRNLFGF